MASAQHAFERVTRQELHSHLCVAHLRHRLRFLHFQRTCTPPAVFLRTPGWSENQNSTLSGRTFRDMLFQPRHDFPLCRRFCGLLARIVVVAVEAQCGTAGVVRQPGARYRQLFQVMPQVFHGVFATRSLFIHASSCPRRSAPGCATVIRW